MHRHDLVLSPQTLAANVSFEARVQAAGAGGFRGISLRPQEYLMAREAGLDDDQQLAILAAANVEVAEIGFVTQWVPGAEGEDGVRRAEAVLWHMAALFRPRQINAGLWQACDSATVTRAFRSLCDRAAEHALLVALEFIPYSAIPDIHSAWQLVQAAQRDNAGLILDTWHLHRLGTPPSVVSAVSPERWFTVQICDALATPWPDMGEESRHGRLLPGAGVVDFHALFAALKQAGAQPLVAVEVISDAMHALAPEAAAREALATSAAVLASAGYAAPWWGRATAHAD